MVSDPSEILDLPIAVPEHPPLDFAESLL